MNTRKNGSASQSEKRVFIAAIGLSMLLAAVLLLGMTGTILASADPPQMTVNYSHDWVGVEAGLSQDVTVEVEGKATVSGSTGGSGHFVSDEWSWDPERPNIVPGDKVFGSVGATNMIVDPVGRISGTPDYDADTVSGTVDAPWFSPETLTVRCEVWVEMGPSGVEVTGVNPDGGSYTCDFATVGWDLQPTETVAILYRQPDGHRVQAVLEPPRIDVNYSHNWIDVWSEPSVAISVVLSSNATVTGMTDEDGRFHSNDWSWVPEYPDIVPGDVATASVAGEIMGVVEVGEIEANLDFDGDIVSGTINAAWLSPALVRVRCDIWEEGGPEGIEVADVNPNGGSYTCDFNTRSWDLQPNQTVAVRYVQPDGHSVINNPEVPWVRVNYGHDWVGANYEVGHTFLITATDAAHTVKAIAEIDTMALGGWGVDGFQTNGDDWQPEQPDIRPGDWVYFSADDGFSKTIRVGDIRGLVDVNDDSISGSIYAEWISETLDVECHPWGGWPGPASNQHSTAEPDGSSSYFCGWGGVWDVQLDQNIAVFYEIPGTRDLVGNVFYGIHTYLPIAISE